MLKNISYYLHDAHYYFILFKNYILFYSPFIVVTVRIKGLFWTHADIIVESLRGRFMCAKI